MSDNERSFGGTTFRAVGPVEACHLILNSARTAGRGVHVHLLNAYSLALADTSSDLKEAYADGALNFSDGKPLTWFTRIGGVRLSQVRGPALFNSVLDHGRAEGVRHFLLGSTEETLLRLTEAIERDFPGAKIVGTFSPPFRPMTAEELRAQDDRIRLAEADIVWVGLGTPKQDYEAKRLAKSLAMCAVAIGAAFDFTSGQKREAPRLFGMLGLEWAFRLATEPRRLWRRYLFGNLRFLKVAFREVVSQR